MLYHLDPDLGSAEQFAPLQRGIDNWKVVYNIRMAQRKEHFFDVSVATHSQDGLTIRNESFLQSPGSTALWQRAGFWKNAAEWWLLAQVLTQRLLFQASNNVTAQSSLESSRSSTDAGPHLLANIEEEKRLAHLHDFLKQF